MKAFTATDSANHCIDVNIYCDEYSQVLNPRYDYKYTFELKKEIKYYDAINTLIGNKDEAVFFFTQERNNSCPINYVTPRIPWDSSIT